jgi:predicted branched-subunit amino acid permease
MVMTMRNPGPRLLDASAWPLSAAGFRRGVLAALPFVVSNGLGGIAMGVAYRGLGFDLATATLFSLLVYSATAQAVALGLWALPPPLLAMLLACAVTNARYLVMGAHLRQLFPELPRRAMLPILALLADASWMMTVAEAERGRRDAGYLLGCGVPMAVGWVGGTALGRAVPLSPHGALAAAAGFLPLAFIVVLLPTQWRGRRSLLPWAVSAAVGLAAALALGASWAMLAGGGAGTLVSALRGDES